MKKYKMLSKSVFLFVVLWNTCIVQKAFCQNYPLRNGRGQQNNSLLRYPSRSNYESGFYSDNHENNFRNKPVNYNDRKDQNTGNTIINLPKPISRPHVTTRWNDNNSSIYNFGTWKILNENKQIQQIPDDSRVKKCASFDEERKLECLRRLNRKEQNEKNNANAKMRQDNNFPPKDVLHTSNNSTVLNINVLQSVNDDKSNIQLLPQDKNMLSTKERSKPCACYWQQEKCGCDCEGTLNYDDFQDVARSFFPCHNFTFIMTDGEFYALPPNFFSKMKNVLDFNLFISNSTFEYMCDPTPLTSPFKGVIFENSARIKLTNVNVRRGWNWKPFEQLKSSSGAQVNVTLENCHLKRLTSDFANLAGGHVDTIDIYNSDLEMVGSKAFGTFENMTRFRIPRNKIRHLRRTDFPELLFNLEELDLRNNELSYLDNDLFTNMPSLKEIVLSGNPISILPEATFRAVISKAELVGISDISLTCDCRLQWLKDSMKQDNRTEKNMKGAICKRPPYLRGMPFDFLSKEHLICS